MAQIPIAAEVAEVIGPFAEKVQNRSLLLDKFVFHKSWPEELDERGSPVKWDDAHRWSFMRVAHGAATLLATDARKKDQEANGKKVAPSKAEWLRAQAQVARQLASIKWDDAELSSLRATHTRRFLAQFAQAFPTRHAIIVAELESRMAINLSDGIIQNAGIALDRLFGLPYVPGSAVKGVCRHVALEEIRMAGTIQARAELFQLFLIVFGSSDNDFLAKGDLAEFSGLLERDAPRDTKGSIDFLPAYPVNEAKITVDLTTVHYPDYYRSGEVLALAKENPRPNPFPVVEKGIRFAFCMTANRMVADPNRPLAAVKRWLEMALTVRGLGAKTASGYGWFSIPADGLYQLQEAERLERELLDRKERARQEARETAERQRLDREKEAARAARNKADAERRKGMTPDQFADEVVAAWGDDLFRTRLSNFCKSKGGPSDDERKAIVRACRGNRQAFWEDLKKRAGKGGEPARIAAEIHKLSKQLNMGKMP